MAAFAAMTSLAEMAVALRAFTSDTVMPAPKSTLGLPENLVPLAERVTSMVRSSTPLLGVTKSSDGVTVASLPGAPLSPLAPSAPFSPGAPSAPEPHATRSAVPTAPTRKRTDFILESPESIKNF